MGRHYNIGVLLLEGTITWELFFITWDDYYMILNKKGKAGLNGGYNTLYNIVKENEVGEIKPFLYRVKLFI